jgi:hypothetical protein
MTFCLCDRELGGLSWNGHHSFSSQLFLSFSASTASCLLISLQANAKPSRIIKGFILNYCNRIFWDFFSSDLKFEKMLIQNQPRVVFNPDEHLGHAHLGVRPLLTLKRQPSGRAWVPQTPAFLPMTKFGLHSSMVTLCRN